MSKKEYYTTIGSGQECSHKHETYDAAEKCSIATMKKTNNKRWVVVVYPDGSKEYAGGKGLPYP